MPADSEVIRQQVQAAFETIQEISNTAVSQMNSIRMTLLSLHGALMTRATQRLAEKNDSLDANLLAVRKKLVSDTVVAAASRPGDSRLKQAEMIKGIVDDTLALAAAADQARTQSRQKIELAEKSLDSTRQKMLQSFGS